MPFYERPQEPLAHVIEFLDQRIHDYVVGDLTRLAGIRPDHGPRNLRGCTIPEALTVFAVLDLLGFLMRKDFDDEKELDVDRLIEEQATCAECATRDADLLTKIRVKFRDNTSDNLEFMLKNWLCQESNAYDELARELIIKLFRHGGAHQFLPKAAGIAKWGLDRPLIELWKADDGFPKPILNEDLFRKDFLATVDRITLVLKNNDDQELKKICGDTVEKLAKRMSTRLAILHWLDRNQLMRILRPRKPDLLPSRSSQTKPTVLPTV